MMSNLTYFCGLATAIYVNTCLVVATVRWFHMCQPYDKNPKYYYPGRPFVTASWLSSLTLLPYVFHPDSFDALFLVCTYFLPVIVYNFALLLFSYFGTVMQWKKWQRPMMLVCLPVALFLLGAIVIAVIPGDQLAGIQHPMTILYAFGALVTAFCLFSLGIVRIWANRFDPDDYSKPSDFPVAQARRWMALIIVNVVLCWTGVLLHNPVVLAWIELVIAASSVLLLISALPPNRSRPFDDPPPAPQTESAATPESGRPIPNKKQAEILAAIRAVVEEQQSFLDPHLTLQDVATRCGYSRTYISALIKENMGGFVNYVNRLRMDYMETYLKNNPDATLGEAIDASGFGSRPTYYNVKKRLNA